VNGASGGTMAVTAPSGNTSYGIVVGSGASAGSTPSPSAPYLKAQIPQGTSSGQIEYGAVSVSSVSQSGQTTSFTISRSFTNVSGATLTVTEIGIIVYVLNRMGYVSKLRRCTGQCVLRLRTNSL